MHLLSNVFSVHRYLPLAVLVAMVSLFAFSFAQPAEAVSEADHNKSGLSGPIQLGPQADYIRDLQERVAALEALLKSKPASVSPYSIGGTRATQSTQNTYLPAPTKTDPGGSSETPEAKRYTFNANMGSGTRGERVVALQQCLSDLGHFTGEKANVYGPKTTAAVKRFQTANGIASNGTAWTTGYGYVGPKTRAMLSKNCNATPIARSIFDSASVSDSKNFVVAPASGKAPLEVTFKSRFSGQAGVPKVYYGDGKSENITTCSAPADRCTDFGVNTHTYTKVGTYNVVVKDDRQVYYRRIIKVGLGLATPTLPKTVSGEGKVDLKFEIYGDDAGFYDELPRKVAALRKATLKWDTENVNNCTLKLAYDSDRVTKKITKASGEMRVDRVKPYDTLGLDYVQLTCRDANDKRVTDRIAVAFYNDTADARVYVDGTEKNEYKDVTREEALSRCLSVAVNRTNKDKAVGCVFGERIIYQHGDDPFPKSLIRVVDKDAEVYEDGNEADSDTGEEDTTGFIEKLSLKAVKSGREVMLRFGIDGLVCGAQTGSQVIGTIDWGDGETDVVDWFCDSKNFKQTNAHRYNNAGIYKVTLTTKELGTKATETVSVGDVRGAATSAAQLNLAAALKTLEDSVKSLQSSLGL